MPKRRSTKTVAALTHGEASRKNIPTAEYQTVMEGADQSPIQVAYKRRNRDLDPQLVWRGKDAQDWSDLVVQAPPLFIQEKVHPKVLIDDLRQQRRRGQDGQGGDGVEVQPDLFVDFNGLPSDDARTEFYQHDANWSNRMILGDSLQVMASLAEREGLRGKVQCIYLDPPYGIKFNSNFQWSTTSRDVKDGKAEHISREPEQVKAFRDTWRDGIHSYLSYLRDRLIVARELLNESGSIFVQISNENVHRVRCILDEVFGSHNVVASIAVKKASPDTRTIKNTFNYILWYARDAEDVKARKLYRQRELAEGTTEDPKKLALWLVLPDGTQRPLTTEEKRQETTLPQGAMVFRADKVRDSGQMEDRVFGFGFCGETLFPGDKHCWRGDRLEMERLRCSDRLLRTRERSRTSIFFQIAGELKGRTFGRIQPGRFQTCVML